MVAICSVVEELLSELDLLRCINLKVFFIDKILIDSRSVQLWVKVPIFDHRLVGALTKFQLINGVLCQLQINLALMVVETPTL